MPHTLSRKSIILTALVLFSVLGTACGAGATPVETPTPTLLIITATLPPTATERPSATPEPPTPTVPVEPVAGQTTSQLNVRNSPSAESEQLGTVQIFQEVQIVGKNPEGTWWLIVFPDSPTGTGWITAEFVQVTGTAEVPVFDNPTPGANTTRATAATTSQAGAGPTVSPGSASSPPAASPPAPAQSLATAFEDGDSPESPGVSIALSRASVRSFNYNSDISAPEGDPADWVQFRLEGPADQPITVSVILTCTGSGALRLELLQNNAVLQSWQDISCGQPSQLLLNLFVSAPYSLHLAPAQADGSPKYIDYTLMVTLQ